MKNDYEDKRKLIEIEKNILDINVDTNDLKPTVTRKLRRRGNDTAQNLSSNVFVNTANTTSALVSLSSSHLQQFVNNVQGSSVISLTSIQVNTGSERKRRPSPSNQINFVLHDDDINDDLKYLIKSVHMIRNKPSEEGLISLK